MSDITIAAPAPSVPAPNARTNSYAILSLVFAFIFWPLGIFFGHKARKQIKATGEAGDGLATAGLVLGYLALAGTIGLLVLSAAVAASFKSTAPDFGRDYLPTASSPALPTTTNGGITDGTYVIGTDMPAGTYRTAGPANGLGACVWQRLANTSGDFNAAIAQNVTAGPDVVTVAPTDKAFTTTGCQSWSKVS